MLPMAAFIAPGLPLLEAMVGIWFVNWDMHTLASVYSQLELLLDVSAAHIC